MCVCPLYIDKIVITSLIWLYYGEISYFPHCYFYSLIGSLIEWKEEKDREKKNCTKYTIYDTTIVCIYECINE